MWSSISILLACISGSLFFGERINFYACLLIIIAIYLIYKDKKNN